MAVPYTITDKNGVKRNMTAEETTAYDKDLALAAEERQAITDAEAVIENNKVSGKTKLKDLGLTDDEISALIG